MEFPDLGKHCSEPTCKQLDFLPLKCDACEQIFCKDHITYVLHNCSSAYKKDVQVPVCPLCNIPIPVKRGQTPDIVVGEHIDRDCKSDPAQQKRKIFTNKCGKSGCRQKELMKVICEDCHGNFCLKHRHPLDHECKGKTAPISRAGHAALFRSQASSSKAAPVASSHTASKPASQSQPQRSRANVPSPQLPAAAALQNGLTEEEALQRALEMSLAESAQNATQQHSSQEEEDLALARALSASEEEYRRQQEGQGSRNAKQSTCSMC
ncbi:AN1-type zinc finger protein 2B isoform X1 [Hyla sarda]|uniref:AN1-type zinc finger protein 2B isoform X1 n=2 Tax=Hyla sarda TaxID=327740 RepID=UPI0024C2966B|nr:AN1-type zinc finger protein 2B isoform X1 [Hyla sarda]XP_056391837.1 AN1-type zinc finger protein 2B isoform X1 [Hyla sarda]XP_056391838.1 AN1-type zinc finger protein 2B isoform X1 [Hyla sarda]XP_056391839.1 AN1-type zinc finger protein 2B isoform X1 [Hyla sarda]XP_056391841.1 AN1-type zinc finger protein 2B isoform X1 [Hyla sarda]XP_056391842.1 AN1-type zinc finger protein 2B isoform X1 [Hyla sarda]